MKTQLVLTRVNQGYKAWRVSGRKISRAASDTRVTNVQQDTVEYGALLQTNTIRTGSATTEKCM